MSQFLDSKILILDGNQRASLAAVRSLGERGLWVAVGESSFPSLAGNSRHCKQSFTYGDPQSSPRQFFDRLLQVINDLGVTFLLPITEATTYVILRYREELPSSVMVPFPSTASIEKLANKNNLFKLAMDQQIPTPFTIFCQNRWDGLSALSDRSEFPVVLKPFKSKILEADGIVSTQVFIAKTRQEAESLIKANSFFNYPFTIQSFIEGAGQGVFALYDHGQPVCYFSHRRMREKPPGGGVSVLSESSPIDNSLKKSAEKLLTDANWHGVAMVEFRVADDGTGYLMEVNPRFWGSLQLAIDSGIDFPWLLYLTCTGQKLPEIQWKHRRVRWFLGDLDRLIIILKAPFSTYSLGIKLLEICRFFCPNLRTRHEVNRWTDLKPFWLELRQYVKALKNRSNR